MSISIEPEDTTEDKTVTWSSDNESVAKVGEDGMVTAVGNGKTKITATIGEYTQTCTVTVFTPLAEERVTISTDSAVYSGEEIRPSVTVKDGEKILEQDKDYTVGYENNINAGDATVKVTGIGDYTGTVSKGFKIQKAPIVDSMVTLKETTLVYTGKELTPEVVVKDGDRILVKDIDYILDYKNNIDVGTIAQVVVIGCGNYISGVTKEFEIVDTIQLSDSMVTLEKDEYSYTGKAIKPVIKVKDGENTLVEGKDYKVSYSDNVNAETATVKVEGIGAYAGTVEKNFTIMPTVSYRTQVHDYGWEKSYAENGSISGTVGKNKRLETILYILQDGLRILYKNEAVERYLELLVSSSRVIITKAYI
ncbi:MAG: Ig-like domain-containing protein [Dorea formicigenerans]|nr:Ig-like domain-containing protein [Dorea formicigenerans]